MIELTFVLLLNVAGENLEYTPYETLSKCLATKRKIERNVGRYQKDFEKRWSCKQMKVRLAKVSNQNYVIQEIVDEE